MMRFVARHACRPTFKDIVRMESIYDESADCMKPIRVCPTCDELIVVTDAYGGYQDFANRMRPKFKRKGT